MKATIKTQTSRNEPLIISIRLSDPCNNGHDYFAITADMYKPGTKTFTDRNWIAGGCLHDDILKVKKSLKPFIDLHLSNSDGEPMYAVENGFHWFEKYKGTYQVFSHTEAEPADFKAFDILCSHLRIDADECQKLIDNLDVSASIGYDKKQLKEQFASYVATLRPRWKQEAEAAKIQLQALIDKSEVLA